MLIPQIDYDALSNAELAWIQAGAAGNLELAEVATPAGTASGVAILYVKSSDSKLYFQNDTGTETEVSGGAPSSATYVTLSADASLSGERVLTGTPGQVLLTDGGAGSTLTLSLPQSLDTTAVVTFNAISVTTANITGSVSIGADLKVSGSTEILGSATIARAVIVGSASAHDLVLTTPLTLDYGGTGATTAGGARTALGLAIGTNVQAYDAQLADIAGITPAASAFIGSNASNLVIRSSAEVSNDLGLGTMATQAANSVAITGGSVTGITDVTVADGGTGTSSIGAYRVICGGTTDTGVLQTIGGLGTSGQVLTSSGASALPTFSNPTFPTASVQVSVFAPTGTVEVGDGKAFFHIDSRTMGLQLVEVHAQHLEIAPAGTSSLVRIVNTGLSGTSATGTAMLSTPLFVAPGTLRSDQTTAAVVSATGSAVLQNDLLRIDVDSGGTTGSARGLLVTLCFNS